MPLNPSLAGKVRELLRLELEENALDIPHYKGELLHLDYAVLSTQIQQRRERLDKAIQPLLEDSPGDIKRVLRNYLLGGKIIRSQHSRPQFDELLPERIQNYKGPAEFKELDFFALKRLYAQATPSKRKHIFAAEAQWAPLVLELYLQHRVRPARAIIEASGQTVEQFLKEHQHSFNAAQHIINDIAQRGYPSIEELTQAEKTMGVAPPELLQRWHEWWQNFSWARENLAIVEGVHAGAVQLSERTDFTTPPYHIATECIIPTKNPRILSAQYRAMHLPFEGLQGLWYTVPTPDIETLLHQQLNRQAIRAVGMLGTHLQLTPEGAEYFGGDSSTAYRGAVRQQLDLVNLALAYRRILEEHLLLGNIAEAERSYTDIFTTVNAEYCDIEGYTACWPLKMAWKNRFFFENHEYTEGVVNAEFLAASMTGAWALGIDEQLETLIRYQVNNFAEATAPSPSSALS